jgi:hypothetical protein
MKLDRQTRRLVDVDGLAEHLHGPVLPPVLAPCVAKVATCVVKPAGRSPSVSGVVPALRRGAGAGKQVDVAGVHRLAAVCAVQVDVADLAARVVAVEDGWAGLSGEPLVAPGDHDHEHVEELGAFVGQDVFVPWSVVVGAALEHFVLDEVVEPLGQDLA